jgi:heat shock protein HspQ
LLVAPPAKAYMGAMTQADPARTDGSAPTKAPPIAHAMFSIGEVVRHRMFDFRGVIFDVDPVFANSEEWYQSIPAELRPSKDQPYYHLLAENAESSYVAYVSQQNLLREVDGEPVDHPAIDGMFEEFDQGRYRLRRERRQ